MNAKLQQPSKSETLKCISQRPQEQPRNNTNPKKNRKVKEEKAEFRDVASSKPEL